MFDFDDNSFDDDDLDETCNPDTDDDELSEQDAQACWALEVQSQVAIMNNYRRF